MNDVPPLVAIFSSYKWRTVIMTRQTWCRMVSQQIAPGALAGYGSIHLNTPSVWLEDENKHLFVECSNRSHIPTSSLKALWSLRRSMSKLLQNERFSTFAALPNIELWFVSLDPMVLQAYKSVFDHKPLSFLVKTSWGWLKFASFFGIPKWSNYHYNFQLHVFSVSKIWGDFHFQLRSQYRPRY